MNRLSPWQAQQRLQYIKVLRERIAALVDGDEEALNDTLEGQLDLDEPEQITEAILERILDLEVYSGGLNAYIKRLRAKKAAVDERAESLRASLVEALHACGREKIETPIGSVRQGWTKGAVEIDDPDGIPDVFRRPGPPDKTLIRETILSGIDVPGARIAEPEPTITIRKPAVTRAPEGGDHTND